MKKITPNSTLLIFNTYYVATNLIDNGRLIALFSLLRQ